MTGGDGADAEVVPAQLRVKLSAADVDLAVDALWLHGTNGIEERSTDNHVVELRAGFERGSEADRAAESLAERVPRAQIEVRPIRDDAYLDVWRDAAEPIDIGRITLHPSWTGRPPAELDGRVILSLDPGRAFGLGNHPTTQHVVEALQDVVTGGERVLDVGCGSGVLAIAALRLGATEALGIDIDPEAIRASLANAERNGVADRLRLSAEPLAHRNDVAPAVGAMAEPYGIVVANIGAAALIALEPMIRSWCGHDTTLMLSGILDEQAEAVGRVYTDGHNSWASVAEHSTDGWTSLVLSASSPS